MRVLALAPLLLLGGEIRLALAPHDRPRRFLLAEWVIPEGALEPPFVLEDEQGTVPCQWEKGERGFVLRWLVRDLPAGEERVYALGRGEAVSPGRLALVEREDSLVVEGESGEIARYRFGESLRKPCFLPLFAQGRALTRGFPIEERKGDSRDHPHHTGLFVGHGDVNRRDYWSSAPIRERAAVVSVVGPVYARLRATHGWGEDLAETWEATILDVGPDLVIDWTVTLAAIDRPVVLGKTKEGCFAIRVAEALREDRGGAMVNAEGRRGEAACRSGPSAWCDVSGEIGGRKVGVAILNHPESFRFPTDWHVRAYGLLSANPFLYRESHRLEPGESIVLRYRVFGHAGDANQGRVEEVFEGYAHAGRVVRR